MNARRTNPAIEAIVRGGVGAAVDFDGAAYLDEIAIHIREQLGEDAVDRMLAETGEAAVEEVVVTYLDERTGAKR